MQQMTEAAFEISELIHDMCCMLPGCPRAVDLKNVVDYFAQEPV